ncbi:MAG: VCBS repeat-containing protein, partial [Ignavibacteriae bacterium]|nr:VCBS repeat-containing protein [Ignavibacteriota bacterium]
MRAGRTIARFALSIGIAFPCLLPVIVVAQEGEPRHPAIVHFEEIGRLSSDPGELWALGDISGDGIDDFATEHYLDTCLQPSRCAQEILIHYGVKNGLPTLDNAFHLKSTTLLSKMLIRAVGDWDGKNGSDLCVHLRTYNDTAFGNANLVYTDIDRTVIFWNQGDGTYSFSDTTELYPGVRSTFGTLEGVAGDFNNDGQDDLVVRSYKDVLYEGKGKKIPTLHIYLGGDNKEDQRHGMSHVPQWQWWNLPSYVSRLESQDLDHDGAQDLILYVNEANAPLTVFYGRKDNQLPDTISDRQQIQINGLASVFSDVTGDNYADLVILNSAQDFVYCYVSTPSARRLQEMFGTGNDPPREGEWWSRPWATLKGPKLVNQFWFGLGSELYPLGSADTSSPDEIWVTSWPYILVYRTGVRLDSLIDAEIDTRGVGETPVRLGDINGDGRDELAMVGNPTV